ncbi:retron St85 family RNA-directed DNA polymerase [Halomonas salipaludis]|uniref:RNA-directed DNA polymerase n=1 Tax=Halomonas salipaludis TaxID=2032625 RepID=A0A2A2ERP1_9GAMM|nr:retron St85 family RNA-directed DNA polymerase [Halomonas salipaludis]PAU75328.1 reverse transcriptase [Halomonas salipaludis]
MSIISEVSRELDMVEDSFREQIRLARGKIKHIKIKKKNGKGFRRIVIPPWEFKIVQYWTILNYLRNVKIHRSATAFHEGASIRTNALCHRKGNYFVKMDLSDFFPSVGVDDFKNALYKYHPEFIWLEKELSDSEFLESMFHKGVCAIGFPASPYIANICMIEIDELIESKLKNNVERFGRFSYTRYADDLTISIERKGFKREVEGVVYEAVREASLKNIKVNKEKTKYGSKSGGSAFVTGMRICKDGHITLHRKYKDHVRLLLSLYSKGKLKPEDKGKLLGHLNYCKSSDPEFYNKLVLKYFQSIEKLKNSNG